MLSTALSFAAAFTKAGKSTSDVPQFGDYESESFAKPRPLRTDLERMLKGSQAFVDVTIDP